jgi:acyl-CoA thioesterase-1
MFDQGRVYINLKKVAGYICLLLVTLGILAIILEYTVYNNISANLIRVACIGDSITESTDYPQDLQTLLGTNYTVGNFGSSSSTVLLSTHKPYIDQREFINAKNFLPDIAIIMLGTNDARTDHFKSIENFIPDYMKLVNEIQEIKSNPKIFLVKPPPIFDNIFELKNVNLLEEIIPRIEQIANEEKLLIIDVYAQLENHPEYFQDGVHPNSEGATIIANEVYDAIFLSTEIS